MNTEKKIGLYSIDMTRTVEVLIPKKKSDGYLKSCFGGHHQNDALIFFMDIQPKGVGDTFDIDGYVCIEIRKSRWEDGFKELIEAIKAALSKTFPHVTEWKEVRFEELGRIAMLPSSRKKAK